MLSIPGLTFRTAAVATVVMGGTTPSRFSAAAAARLYIAPNGEDERTQRRVEGTGHAVARYALSP